LTFVITRVAAFPASFCAARTGVSVGTFANGFFAATKDGLSDGLLSDDLLGAVLLERDALEEGRAAENLPARDPFVAAAEAFAFEGFFTDVFATDPSLLSACGDQPLP